LLLLGQLPLLLLSRIRISCSFWQGLWQKRSACCQA
jgi:hypothetical protein